MKDSKNITGQELKEIAKNIRHNIVDMIGYKKGKVGHLGGSTSAADIVTALYFYKMNFSKENYRSPDRDRFILSKGHVALVQYAALIELGILDKNEIDTIKEINSRLQGHPDKLKTPGIEANTGSLGQGLSIGLGIALGNKIDGIDSRTYVMMGDGEQAEGQIWEAATVASAYRLNRLVGILDHNRYQAMGSLEDRLSQGNLKNKWEAFDWHVIPVDGHNIEEICKALDDADKVTDCPVLIFAETVKGKGVSFAEDTHKFHNAGLNQEQYERAHESIDNN